MDSLTIATPGMWIAFIIFVIAMVIFDLFFLGGKDAKRVSTRQALTWSVVWVVMAMAFNALLWWWVDASYGRELANVKAQEFLAGYLIEKALAIDNIFVFLMIFSYFSVPAEYQRRVLIFGVLGAIIMRTVLILAGAVIVAKFHWVMYLFGAFLVFTGLKMLMVAEQEPDLSKNGLIVWLKKHIRFTATYEQEKFWVYKQGVRYFTPLFLVLLLVELSDLIFAVDSIPAIFSITNDPFIVYTSNIFAILGLRALYFLLADMADRFHLLKFGLAFVLVFVGVKMLLLDFYKIPITAALLTVVVIIASSIVASLLIKPKK